MKSERLKKLEIELRDLEQWLKLGLVPKKEEAKHKEEIKAIRAKIDEENERLRFLKESGEVGEYVMPKRPQGREAYQGDMPTIHDGEYTEGGTQSEGYETSAGYEEETQGGEEEEETLTEEESYFSPKARRKRWKDVVNPDEA